MWRKLGADTVAAQAVPIQRRIEVAQAAFKTTLGGVGPLVARRTDRGYPAREERPKKVLGI